MKKRSIEDSIAFVLSHYKNLFTGKLSRNLPTPTDSCNVNGECDGSCEKYRRNVK